MSNHALVIDLPVSHIVEPDEYSRRVRVTPAAIQAQRRRPPVAARRDHPFVPMNYSVLPVAGSVFWNATRMS
jgi:hypothetical protein